MVNGIGTELGSTGVGEVSSVPKGTIDKNAIEPLSGVSSHKQETLELRQPSFGLTAFSFFKRVLGYIKPEKQRINSTDYLKSHLENKSVQYGTDNRSSPPTSYIDYTTAQKGETAEASVTKFGASLTVKFANILPTDPTDIQACQQVFGRNAEHIKILKEMILSREGRVPLILSKILLKDMKVYFYPYHDLTRSCISPEKRLIMLDGDPATILGLSLILHEVGHIVDLRSKPKPQPIQRGFFESLITPNQGAAILLAERNAWAFALKHLARFFDRQALIESGVLAFIHKRGLASHSRYILRHLPRDIASKVA